MRTISISADIEATEIDFNFGQLVRETIRREAARAAEAVAQEAHEMPSALPVIPIPAPQSRPPALELAEQPVRPGTVCELDF